MGTRVNLNGRIVPPERARISVFDRGFLYGDSIYEVLRTYRGAPFALGDHLRRLHHSAVRLGMSLPWPDAKMVQALAETLRAAGNPDSYVRIVVTRGAGPIGLDPALAKGPQTLLFVKPLETPLKRLYKEGARVALVQTGDGDGLPARVDPEAKSGNYLSSILALREARAAGAYEAVMLGKDGRVQEGSSSNVFLVRRGTVVTPPLSAGILEGITRAHVLRLARDLGLKVREEHVVAEQVQRADEAFLTSSIREVLPVTEVVDGLLRTWPVGSGRVGAITARLRRAFRERARREAVREWAALTEKEKR